MRRAEHWQEVYSSRAPNEVSWFQAEPAMSLQLLAEIGAEPSDAVVDIGGGASRLVDRLLSRGFEDLTVLDVAGRALAEVRRRLGARATGVTFVEGDVLTWTPGRRYDVWHDRAVFHFLVEPGERDRYVRLAARTVRDGGHVVVAAFADDGPPQCSGLPVARYSAEALAGEFSHGFTVVAHEREEHVTPQGVLQPFTWVVLRRGS